MANQANGKPGEITGEEIMQKSYRRIAGPVVWGLALALLAGCPEPVAQNRHVGTRVTAEQFAGTDFFNKIQGSSGPVVVDFTADWCGPCQAIKPFLKDLEKEGKIKLVMIDADEHPQILEQFGVSGIPHLLFIKNGQIGNVLRGSTSRARLESIVNQL